MKSKYKIFLKKEYMVHAISYFIFLLTSTLLIQSSKINTIFFVINCIISLLSCVAAIFFEIYFYQKYKNIQKKWRINAFLVLFIISGIIITIIYLILNQFSFIFSRTNWVAVTMIISLSTAIFGISYI